MRIDEAIIKIAELVAEAMDIPRPRLTGPSRDAKTLPAKHTAIWLCWQTVPGINREYLGSLFNRSYQGMRDITGSPGIKRRAGAPSGYIRHDVVEKLMPAAKRIASQIRHVDAQASHHELLQQILTHLNAYCAAHKTSPNRLADGLRIGTAGQYRKRWESGKANPSLRGIEELLRRINCRLRVEPMDRVRGPAPIDRDAEVM